MKRRSVANFLIEPEAIAHSLNALLTTKLKVTDEQVAKWIYENGGEATFIEKHNFDSVFDKRWLENVDGLKLLQKIFLHFSGGVESLQWERDCTRIIAWIADRSVDHFDELSIDPTDEKYLSKSYLNESDPD